MTDGAWYAGRTVLVTGAAGVLGGELVHQLLTAGATVVGVIRDEDRRSALYRSGDADRIVQVRGGLDDLRMLERVLTRYEVSAVFHLGAQTQVRHAERHPLETLESNVRGTYLLLEACRHAPWLDAVVIASSDKAYGESADLPYRETHPLAGSHIYDASKSAADLLAAAYASSFDLPLGIARCANIFGPGDLNWDRIVPGTIRSLLDGQRPVIRSDGSPRRDYIYVGDAAAAYLRLARSMPACKGEAFNFGAGTGIAVQELVTAIQRGVGREDLEPVIRDEASNEIRDQWLDSTKARDVLGWTPTVPLAEGLQRTIAWYRELLG